MGPMSRSLQLGRVAGIPVSVEAGLAVLALLFVGTLAIEGLARVAPETPLTVRLATATVAVALFLASILAHELGHAVAARRRGVGVLGITLSLFGGYAQLDRQAPDPRSEFLIAAAGPSVNLVVGAAIGGLAWLVDRLALGSRLVVGALVWLAVVNVVLAAVNLIPASPLDGGRIATAALWRRLGDADHARILTGRAGLLLGAALIPVGLLQSLGWGWRGLVTVVVGLFLADGARSEIATATIRRRLARTSPRELMVADPPAVQDSLTLQQLLDFAGTEQRRVAFPVVRWGPEPIGYIVPADGSRLSGPDRSWTPVGSLMRPIPEVARAWVNESLDAVLRRQPSTADLVVVVHEPVQGRVVGTLSIGQVAHLLRPPDLWGREAGGS